MNRQFKFRAWDDKENKWLLGYDYPNLGGVNLLGECILYGEWEKETNEFIFEKNNKSLSDLKIMQFTGLHDVNGKEIYEGDIIKGKTFSSNENTFIVSFNNGYGCYQIQTFGNKKFSIPIKSFYKDLEVIGNIHDNPELLNQ
jgi:uncharacterized phage protein (TIGR01671 family)